MNDQAPLAAADSHLPTWRATLFLAAILGASTLLALVVVQARAFHYLENVEANASAASASELFQSHGWLNVRRVFGVTPEDLAAEAPETGPLRLKPDDAARLRIAEESFRKALNVDPRPPLSPDWSGVYQVRSIIAEALGDSTRALALMSAAAWTSGNTEGALELAQKTLLNSPLDDPSTEMAHWVALEAGLRDGATTSLSDRAASLTRLDGQPGLASLGWEFLGRMALREKMPESAVEHLEKALANKPERSKDIVHLLATARSLAGDRTEAWRTMEAGADRNLAGRDPAYLHRLALLMMDDNQLERASRTLEAAGRFAPGNADVIWSRAQVAHRQGKSRQAARLLQQALAIEPALAGRSLE